MEALMGALTAEERKELDVLLAAPEPVSKAWHERPEALLQEALQRVPALRWQPLRSGMDREDRHLYYQKLLGAARSLSEEHVLAVERLLVLNDLFYLLHTICGRKDINRDWLFARCAEVQESPNDHIDIWAREHYKSTIITFALTIQDILRDPSVTIGIFSHTRPIAKDFLSQIKRELERNLELQKLFPDVLWTNPKKEAPQWSEDDGIIVKRKTNPKESTLEAYGLVDGMPTGKHFMIRVYDDVIEKKATNNADMIRKATESWELSIALGAEGGTERYIGTRYNTADTYRAIMDRGAAKPRIHPCTDDGTETGEPVLITRESLKKKRRKMGPYTFSAQMLCNPTADKKQGFLAEWLEGQSFRSDNEGQNLNKYILVDPASAKKKESDYTVMVVLGLGGDDNYYLLDMVRDRLNLRERKDALFSLHRRWHPLKVGYEQYGMQCDIEYIAEQMDLQNYRFPIIPLGGGMAKPDRIKRLVPVFEGGHFFFVETLLKTDYEGRTVDLIQAFIEEEYKPFPVALHDDMLDAISRIEDADLEKIWPTPQQPKEDRYARRRKQRPRPVTWMGA